MLEEMKDRQAKMASIQSSMQSGDIKSRFVAACSVCPRSMTTHNYVGNHSLSALMAGDEEPKTTGTRAQPVSSGASQSRKGGNKNKKR